MTDDADIIERAEIDIDRLVKVLHNSGLAYWQLLRLFLLTCNHLYMKSDAEEWLK